MKYFLFILCTGLLYINTRAQQTAGSIKGTIKDSLDNPIQGATVNLSRANDLKIAISKAAGNGRFEFNMLQDGQYILTVTAIGYRIYKKDSLVINNAHQYPDLSITLQRADRTSLAAVTVSAKRPLIRQELDKTIVDVSAMIGSSTSNTLEVLEKTPGVIINAGGDVSLNGKGGVTVMINGRSNYMSAQDLAAYLKSLPGALVDKIELIENPSARYDASGNAIINIRLKKNITAGFTGSVVTGYSQGVFGKNNDALNLSYLRKKINLFINTGYNDEKNYTTDHYDRNFYSDAGKLSNIQSLKNNQHNKLKGTNINLGMDYAASPSTTVGFLVNRNESKRNGQLDAGSMNYDPAYILDSISSGKITDLDKRTNWATNLNLTHKFKNPGTELSADLNYLNYHTNSNQQSQSDITAANGNPISDYSFIYVLPSDINIYTGKIDYTQPIHKTLWLDAGIKSSLVNNDNIADFFYLTASGQQIDNSRSNHFKYSENINAAYINTRKNWDRLSAQVGLRFENTKATGNQLGNVSVASSRFTKNYSKVFPSMFVSYKLDTVNKNTLTFSVTQRIARPNYQLLNPFLYYRDRYTYISGNQLLNPQYQQRYELRLQHKQFFRTALSYNQFKQSIFQVIETVGNSFISKPENIAHGYMLLLSTSISYSPVSWWNLNTDILLSRVGLKGDGNNEQLNFNANIARLNLINQLRFKNGWSADFGGYYASQDFTGQTRTSGMIRTNAGIQKKIWKDNGAISVTVADIFHSWVYHNRSIDLKQAEFYQTSESDTRRIGVAFTYRFGREVFKSKRNHTDNASDEEKSRVQ